MPTLLAPCLLLFACGGPSAQNGVHPPPVTAAGTSSAARSALTPPVAEPRAHEVPSPHGGRNDPYFWLRDDTRKDPAVLAYLNAENDYAKAALAPVDALEETLFTEMRSRIKEDDASVPVFDDGYWYYSRFETGKQQPIYARRKSTMNAPEEILLDGNQLAEGHGFYRIGRYTVSRNGKLLAWADDIVGRNQYTLHIKDLSTGKLLPDTAANIAPSLVWANDNRTLFYVGKDETTLRPDRVFSHVLGAQPAPAPKDGGSAARGAAAADTMIFKENDGSYYVGIGPTKSRRYVAIGLESTTNSEVRLLDADKPSAAPRVFLARSKDHLYDLDHLDGRFLIRTNADAKNFRLVEVRDGASAEDRKKWKELIPHRADVLIEQFAVYQTFIAASVRTGGLRKIQILPNKKPAYLLDSPDAASTMTVIDTPDANAKRVRFAYDSMTTPSSIFEADVVTKERTLLKQQPVPGYDPSAYTSEYLHAKASDGTAIPISISYRKNTPRDGTAPLMVYGYGSYGLSLDPGFNHPVVSLLDRGFVYALAHVRGGQEMGRAWYEDGKLMKKTNTFTDFITVTEYLVTEKYGARDQVFAQGVSAGGLLMGAIANMRPDLYRGIVALVPFVDVVTGMLDESIPLTTNEYDEWGNPKDKAAYDYMLTYSPYDNVRAQAYPSIYVRTGLWDSQVQYFDPAKWVAKLRATKTDQNLLVMDIDMTSGHGGASGRFDRLRQTARATAFMLHVRDRPDSRKK